MVNNKRIGAHQIANLAGSSSSNRLNNQLDLYLFVFKSLLIGNIIKPLDELLAMHKAHPIGIKVYVKNLLIKFNVFMQRHILIDLEPSTKLLGGDVGGHGDCLLLVWILLVNLYHLIVIPHSIILIY